MDLIDDAIHSKSLRYNKALNLILGGYMTIHLATRILINKDPRFNHRWLFNTFRFGKYLALGGWVYGYWRGGLWYLDELKKAKIYDYKIKRARLYKDSHVARKIYKYGEERTKMEQIKQSDQAAANEANAIISQKAKN